MPLLVEEVEDNVEGEEQCEETLYDQRVVRKTYQVIQHARERRPEEVARGEGRGEQPGHHGLSVGSCGESGPDS